MGRSCDLPKNSTLRSASSQPASTTAQLRSNSAFRAQQSGLVHSDGCRVVANDRGVRSIRYHFSNRSEDINGLFTAALDKLGIHWTRSTKYIVSIYRKADTARLDEFFGPKTRAVPLEGVHYAA
jgi:hypothetical protein